MWPLFMSGGAGFEWYVRNDKGWHSFDQNIDDLREIGPALEWSGHLLEFFDGLPYWRMEPDHADLFDGEGYLFEDLGSVYAVYLPTGDSVRVTISPGEYDLTWFNPRTGEEVDGGTVSGGWGAKLGQPPFDGDAAAILRT
jgi:hypothetical protein